MSRYVAPDPTMIALTIPFPPSANSYIRHSRGGHFPTKKAREFRTAVAEIVAAMGIKPLATRLQVTMRVFPPSRQKRDLDNSIKPALDALQHAGCFPDDEAIDEIHVVRGPVQKGGSVKVLILAAGDA